MKKRKVYLGRIQFNRILTHTYFIQQKNETVDDPIITPCIHDTRQIELTYLPHHHININIIIIMVPLDQEQINPLHQDSTDMDHV
jgi:hypothetical protein